MTFTAYINTDIHCDPSENEMGVKAQMGWQQSKVFGHQRVINALSMIDAQHNNADTFFDYYHDNSECHDIAWHATTITLTMGDDTHVFEVGFYDGQPVIFATNVTDKVVLYDFIEFLNDDYI